MPPPSRQGAGGATLAPANAMSWRLWPVHESLQGFVLFLIHRAICCQAFMQIDKITNNKKEPTGLAAA